MELIDLSLFCKLNIHPNIITLMGLVTAALLPLMHFNNLPWVLFFSIWIRQLCDCIDGAVARKCKKTSKIGGYLDFVADFIFFYSMLFIVLSMKFNLLYSAIISGCLMTLNTITYYYIYGSHVLHDHSDFKNYDQNSIYKSIFALAANNTFLLGVLIGIVYLMLYVYRS